MTKSMLQIGDVIYVTDRGKISGRIRIDRVTRTYAIAGDTRFKRSYGDFISLVKERLWNTTLYEIETPELKAAFEKKALIKRISTFDFNTLDIEIVRAIIKTIEDGTNYEKL